MLLVPAAAVVVGALITGVFALLSGGHGSGSEGGSPRPTPTVATPAAPPGTATGPTRSPTATATAATGPATPESPAGSAAATPERGGVRRAQDGLVLVRNYGIDLDATVEDSVTWRYGEGVTADGHDFYHWHNGTIGADARVVAAAPDRAACETTGYGEDISAKQVSSGLVLCVKTREDRYARVTVTKVDLEKKSMTIDVVVWN
ncbi:hypothetical protein [Streptomyces sp. NPDC093225]|uniref:hypothetical protein n=1 Tax=Streptomyces sp. NPDC093225 TaxID=3366034 RepID=UPI00381C6E7D